MHTATLELWRSTVGRKALVAVSGVALWGWVLLHLAGTLTLFSGPDAADGYAAALRGAPAALWGVRVGLAVAAAVHVAGVISLTRADRAARPRYQGRARPRSLASRGMRLSGGLLLAFVAFHVLHLTFGRFHPGFVPGHVYDNVVHGLRAPAMAAVYAGAAALLGLHLFHGLWAAARSLGVRPAAASRRPGPLVALIALAMTLGFASIPLAVLAGALR